MESKSLTTPMSPLLRIVFWLVAFNALLGALSLMFLPTRTNEFFFWEIKPAINAVLFGALYLGGAAIVAWLCYRGAWEPARFLVPVLVTAGVLISITTLLHLNRFEPGVKLAYWLIIYMGAPLLALLFYAQHERGKAIWSVSVPVNPLTRMIAIALGAILVLLAVLMLIAPDFAVANWPWPNSPLMVRVFASWFGAFGAGLLWFHFERDWQRLQYIANLMIAASALDLLMVFIHRADLSPVGLSLWVYLFHLTAFGLIGVLMHWLQRNGG